MDECGGEREREWERACKLGRSRFGGRNDWWLLLVMAWPASLDDLSGTV